MREAVLLTLAVAVFVGLVGLSDGGVTNEQATRAQMVRPLAAPSPTTSRKDSYAAWVAGTTELPRAPDGHFYAEATVNTAPIRFLVDTGASVVALTGADARAAGLSWSDADVRPIAQGASGPVEGVPVMLERLTLDRHEADNVRAVIVPDGLPVSLLGQSFLQQIDPVRIERERMVLGG